MSCPNKTSQDFCIKVKFPSRGYLIIDLVIELNYFMRIFVIIFLVLLLVFFIVGLAHGEKGPLLAVHRGIQKEPQEIYPHFESTGENNRMKPGDRSCK